MKKVSDSLRTKYSMLRLYKEDLVSINETINLLSQEITWTTEKYTYDSLDEFISKCKETELRQLEIQSHRPFIRISLYRHNGELSVHSDDVAHEGIYNRL